MGSLSRVIKIPHNNTRELILNGSHSIENHGSDQSLKVTDCNRGVVCSILWDSLFSGSDQVSLQFLFF